ncbi:MAG: sigma 54-interacting transcriptional regulator [candidate division KSB1 bacterium]|nr:sigma 54-interacting transcriptional regulator [candidate division KSB1 bacterium]
MPKDSKIFIVEDEPVVAEDIKSRLIHLGYQVLGRTTSGEKAVEIVGDLAPDLVLMDIRLSGEMNGIEAAIKIRELYHRPVVFLTAYADDSTLFRAKEAETFGYIVKPFDDQTLRTTIEMALYKHKMDEVVRLSELQLRRSQAIAHLGHWTWDLAANQFSGSEEFFRIFGIDDGKFSGNLYDLLAATVHEEDKETVLNVHQAFIKENKFRECEFRLRRGKDQIIHVWAHPGDRIENSKGEVIFASGIVQDITERKQAEQKLRDALEEIRFLKEKLEAENVYLLNEIRMVAEHGNIVAESKVMQNILAQAKQVAQTTSTVLILGETGTGKELLARYIHSMSPRKDRPLVVVNCAAMPASLMESELFGREKGAYTGALTRQIGRFEVADGSTIFLDEIGEMPIETQAKLLRVLENGTFERLGSTKQIKVDVRVIAATNRDLQEEVNKGNFRSDLFYRLNVFPIRIPPLREHREDIPALVWSFIREFQEKMGKNIESIPKKTMDALMSYPWPGNIRELRNATERAMILCQGPVLHFTFPIGDMGSTAESPVGMSLEEMQRKHIIDVLNRTGWRIRGKNGASEILKVKPSTLESKMRKLGIRRDNS